MLRFAGIRNIGSITEASTEVPALRAEAPLLPALGRRGIFLSDGRLAYANDCRVTANISRMLAAGPGPRSARAPPEARASSPKSTWRLKAQFWNENAVRAFAIIIASCQRRAANSKECCHEQYHLAGRGRRYRNCDTQLPWPSLGFAFGDAYAEQVVIWVVSGSLRFAGAAAIGAYETIPLKLSFEVSAKSLVKADRSARSAAGPDRDWPGAAPIDVAVPFLHSPVAA